MIRIWRQLSRITKQRLAWAAAGSVALPWVIGEFTKTFYQPGLANDAMRIARFIDILEIAVSVFALTMVFTVTLGCLITAALKGPRFIGDPFPSDQP